MENQVKKSKYKVGWSNTAGRVAIINRETNENFETFADNIPEELLVQRMLEIRQDELLRDQIIQGTSLDSDIASNGIIIPGQENQGSGEIIV